jgi:hypothetical protein
VYIPALVARHLVVACCRDELAREGTVVQRNQGHQRVGCKKTGVSNIFHIQLPLSSLALYVLKISAHLIRHTDYNTKQVYIWRPWEVALFAQCASQDEWFKDAVLGTHGHSSLVSALDCMLLENQVGQIRWEAIAITLRALAFLSEHEWVAGAIDIGTIRSLLRVLRCVRFPCRAPCHFRSPSARECSHPLLVD